MAVLALLMAGTSWAVASWVSAWLVLPYLILMALLLFPTTGRPSGDPDGAESESSDRLRPDHPAEDLDDSETDRDDPASAGRPDGGSEPGTPTNPARARRGKGRGKKVKAPPEPSEATWVQVAPGKFVRVEASETSGPAGPHSPVGVPVEVPSTPQPSATVEANPPEPAEGSPGGNGLADEPNEDTGPAPFDIVEGGLEDVPTGDVESESPTTFESDETAGSPGLVEGIPAADGNAPRAGDTSDETEAGWPDLTIETAVDDRAWAEPESEGPEPVDAPASDDLTPRQQPTEWSGLVREPDREGWLEREGAEASEVQDASPAEGPEPTETPTLADVPTEDADEWGATLERADPTETPVDETDLDDAGPLDAAPPELGPSRDTDAPETDAFPGPSNGSIRWPGRLATVPRTRVGHPPRGQDRRATPRRPVRSPGPARRPPDPRRIDRRGQGRSRQITRPFPPRSPPAGRIGRGRLRGNIH